MSRLILACAVFALASGAQPAFAQPDWEWRESQRDAQRDARREAREDAREARERARQAQRDAREARRDARAAQREAGTDWRRRNSGGVRLRILRSYSLPAGQTVNEPIVVIGGSADIDGRAEDDVVVIGGSLRLGPNAVVVGDVSAIGGTFERAPTARIDGQLDETAIVWPDIDFGFGAFNFGDAPQGWWAVASLGAMTVRLGLVLFVSLLITWFAPGWMAGIGARASSAAGSSWFLGLATQVLFVPALIVLCVILVISILGIPLLLALPFVLAFAAVIWTAGFAAVVGRVGGRLRGQAPGTSTSPTLDLMTGFVVVTALTVTAHFLALGPWWTGPASWALMAGGWLVEWIVWTLGLGAALSSMMGWRSDAPPAIPITPQPAPSML